MAALRRGVAVYADEWSPSFPNLTHAGEGRLVHVTSVPDEDEPGWTSRCAAWMPGTRRLRFTSLPVDCPRCLAKVALLGR